jgi:hypothetical protein
MLAAIAAATTQITNIWETGAYLKPDVSMMRVYAAFSRRIDEMLLGNSAELVGHSLCSEGRMMSNVALSQDAGSDAIVLCHMLASHNFRITIHERYSRLKCYNIEKSLCFSLDRYCC